ncbi:MAG: phenylacetate--CoA ligase family protein [Chloroflexota bacterium]
MMFEPKMERLPRPRLAELQFERLRAVLTRVRDRVPFYSRRLADAGVRAEDLGSPADVRTLPFTSKSDLREHYPFGLLAVRREEVARLHASSGTKGKPTVVAYTKADLDLWAACCARSLACAGARPGDVIHNAYGYGLFTGGLGLHYGAERLGAAVVPASGGNTARQVLLLQDFEAGVLCCTPSYALNIAGAAEAAARTLPVRIGVFGAEPWTVAMRERIEEALNLRALDIYGLSEVLGPGVAMECAEGRDGLHIWEDHFLAEVIDPGSGQSLPEGEVGELVLTTLTKEAMPVIRYRTGDLTSLSAEPCPCGRTHRRMARVSGRTDDMLIIRGVNVFPTEIERVLLTIAELSPHYRIVVDRPEALDSLEIQVEVGTVVNGIGPGEHGEALRRHAARLLESALGVSAAISIQPQGSLPRSEGKAQRVLDRRTL